MRHVNVYITDRLGKVIDRNISGSVNVAAWAEQHRRFYDQQTFVNWDRPLKILRSEKKYDIGAFAVADE